MEHSYGYFEEGQDANFGDYVLWRRILKFILPQKKAIILAISLSVVVIFASLSLPHLIRIAIDDYIIASNLSIEQRHNGLYTLTQFFILLLILSFVASFFQVTILEKTGQITMHKMRQKLFSHMILLDLDFFNKNPTGKLVTRVTNDIQNMHEMFTSVIVTLFNDCLQLIGILIVLYVMNVELALIMTMLLPLIAIYSLVFSKKAREAFRSIRTQLAMINSFLQESISGITLIQHFQEEKATQSRFDILNQSYTDKTHHQIKIFAIFQPMIEVVSTTATAMIILYGGWLVLQGDMTIGVLAAFLSYMRLFFKPVREISQKYSIIQSAMASAERIFELIDEQNPLLISNRDQQPKINGNITFNRVTFSYSKGDNIISDLTLSIKQGETVAIVGPTGSGKTTLINLIERLYDVDDGAILIDDTNLKDIKLQYLRNQIGLVIQDVFLVPGTFYYNLCFGKEISNRAIDSILKKAQLTEIANDLPDKLETFIGEGGYELSTGQKQLLALGRVLVRNPNILILDEATANIDSVTESLIEKAINQTTQSRTSIIIAHRLSTIHYADRIIVFDQGMIKEQGTFDELLVQGGMFKKMVDQQSFKASL